MLITQQSVYVVPYIVHTRTQHAHATHETCRHTCAHTCICRGMHGQRCTHMAPACIHRDWRSETCRHTYTCTQILPCSGSGLSSPRTSTRTSSPCRWSTTRPTAPSVYTTSRTTGRRRRWVLHFRLQQLLNHLKLSHDWQKESPEYFTYKNEIRHYLAHPDHLPLSGCFPDPCSPNYLKIHYVFSRKI